MNDSPLFSVLIANYNNGRYLPEAIESVISQTYSNWEIIIVDDCSTDNSKDIYTKLENETRIKIFYNDANKGVGYTKKRLCELAQGEIAGFLDADDALINTSIEKMCEAHTQLKEVALIYSTFYICDTDLNILRRSSYQEAIPVGKTYLDCTLGRVSHFASFKLQYYKLTKGINPEFILAEDQDLYFKLEEVGGLFYIDEPLYRYRMNSKGVSQTDSEVTVAWGLIAKYEACKRRGLDPAKYFLPVIGGEKNIISFYENSRDYKIGKFFLMPYRFLKYKLFRGKY
ncbi:MAG: glycosyltransferase [Bacteroidota bacterium]